MAEDYDSYTFLAEDAISSGQTFEITCNCGGKAPVTAPLSTEFVVCPKCTAKIKVLLIEGDPGYIMGVDAGGEPTLLPVQGSKAIHPSLLPPEERKRIIEDIKRNMPKRTSARRIFRIRLSYWMREASLFYRLI